jgi:hypothetical protein
LRRASINTKTMPTATKITKNIGFIRLSTTTALSALALLPE